MKLTLEQKKKIFTKFMSDMSSDFKVMPYPKDALFAVISEMDNVIEVAFVSGDAIIKTNMLKLAKETDGESKDITFKQGEIGKTKISVAEIKENLKGELLSRILKERMGVK